MRESSDKQKIPHKVSLISEPHVVRVSVYFPLYVTVANFETNDRFSLHSKTTSYLDVTLKMEVVVLLVYLVPTYQTT